MNFRENTDGISPYRMSQLVKASSDVTERIVSGKYIFSPTYRECEIILELVAEAIRKCKDE